MKTDTKIRRRCSGEVMSSADLVPDVAVRAKQQIIQAEKTTRWDRITKKHLNAVSVQTTQVRRFFDMNFVSGDQQMEMGGRGDVNGRRRKRNLDPALVMDMRHEIIRRNRTPFDQNKIKTAETLKTLQLERIRSHHQQLEQKYVDQEIEKFREFVRVPKKAEFVVNLNNYPSSDNDSTAATHCPYETDSEFDLDNLLSDLNPSDDKKLSIINREENYILDVVDDKLIRANEKDFKNKFHKNAFGSETKCHEESNGTAESEYGPQKTVRFDAFIEKIQYNHAACSDDDDLIASVESSYSFEDQFLCDEYEKKHPGPMQLIGTPLKVPQKTTEAPNMYQRIIETPSRTHMPSSPKKSTVLTVTKIDISQERQKSSSTMSVSLTPKQEVAMEQNEIIKKLFRTTSTNATPTEDVQLLRQYFLHWIHFTTMEKMQTQCGSRNDSRSRKIQQFLNNIQREKKKTLVKEEAAECVADKNPEPIDFMKRKFNSKIKVQRDIIELQKIKLERQERMITELKLNRLAEDTRLSQANSKQELRNVIRNGNAKSRTTARCLQLVGNLREADDMTAVDEYAIIQAKGMPKFLVDMQNRAMERNARHNDARERREQLEREKEEQRLAAEAAKLKRDEEAKRRRIEELREKRRQERLQRQQREEDRVRHLDNMHKAATFNRKRLLTRYGMDAFHALIKLKRRNQRKVDMFRVFIALQSTFRTWNEFVVQMWAERKRNADHCRRLQLLRLGMSTWKKYQDMQHSKFLVAIDWYEMRLADRMFRSWNGYTRHQKCIEEVKMRQAEAHYNWHLKWRVIEHWQRLHAILQLEKETDERRQKWRMKIWELLPDYQPGDGDHLTVIPSKAKEARRSDYE